MNARPNVSDCQHAANHEAAQRLREEGYEITVSSQGYKVAHRGRFIAASGTKAPPHGRYREANTRDNLQSALSLAVRDRAEQAERMELEIAELRYWGLRAGSIAGSLTPAEERELKALETFRAVE